MSCRTRTAFSTMLMIVESSDMLKAPRFFWEQIRASRILNLTFKYFNESLSRWSSEIISMRRLNPLYPCSKHADCVANVSVTVNWYSNLFWEKVVSARFLSESFEPNNMFANASPAKNSWKLRWINWKNVPSLLSKKKPMRLKSSSEIFFEQWRLINARLIWISPFRSEWNAISWSARYASFLYVVVSGNFCRNLSHIKSAMCP